MKNLLSYCGLVDAEIRASDKDLHVFLFCCFSFISQNLYYISIHCTPVRVGVFFSCENFMQRMQATGGPKDDL